MLSKAGLAIVAIPKNSFAPNSPFYKWGGVEPEELGSSNAERVWRRCLSL
ncbi:hypothetical protein AM1_A0140 (plasmid) [Acaryochloris marina MBIC11017]|uniref:Uncharacterized protein n=1 Tax=Acaryochloris marina (strain MBIC 11017) TaxID=329726 RepID=A8ZKE9_ACAM1|nr:hypothetical protein AM1_A0140 [Acaryochloris marina MBIC11017]